MISNRWATTGLRRGKGNYMPESWAGNTLLKLVLVATLVCLWTFASVSKVDACSCGWGSPSSGYESSTVVFAGTVVAKHKVTKKGFLSTSPDTEMVLTELRVDTAWKGPVYETMFVRSDGPCGLGFTEGEDYLVYAYDASRYLWTSACTRTVELDEYNYRPRGSAGSSVEDLRWLGQGRPPEPGTFGAPPPTPTPTPAPPPTPPPTPPPIPTPTPSQSAGGCGLPSASSSAPKDAWALALIAGVAWLGFRKNRRR